MSGLEASLVLIGAFAGLMLVLGVAALGGVYFLSRRGIGTRL